MIGNMFESLRTFPISIFFSLSANHGVRYFIIFFFRMSPIDPPFGSLMLSGESKGNFWNKWVKKVS